MWDDTAALEPFRRTQAPEWLTEPRIRRALRSGDLIALRRGVLVGRLASELAWHPHALATQVAIAGLRGGSPAVGCLGSAALLHGVARLGQPPQRVRLYRERGGPWRDDQVAVLVCGLPQEHVTTVHGTPATTLARTVVDLGRWVSFRSAVVSADSALRLGCPDGELEAVLSRCKRWPGSRKARRAVEFADARAESPLESISRVAFHEMGLPAPELQVTLVYDEFGKPRIIVDFFWKEFGVVGEADGLLKYDDEEERRSLREEKLRQEEIEALGYIVVRWTWDDIWRRPEWVAMRLRRAFESRRRVA
jgi:hypothetical protein